MLAELDELELLRESEEHRVGSGVSTSEAQLLSLELIGFSDSRSLSFVTLASGLLSLSGTAHLELPSGKQPGTRLVESPSVTYLWDTELTSLGLGLEK